MIARGGDAGHQARHRNRSSEQFPLHTVRRCGEPVRMQPAAILDDISAIARAAGEIILRHFAAPIPTTSKTSRIDIVTAADTEVEAFIARELLQRFPDHHLVGEEGGGQGAKRAGAPYLWFVDPLDGTVNFASKFPHFCTSIALTTPDRRPLLGVTYDPTRGELFTAVRGGGARLNGRPLHVTATAELAEALLVSGFPYDKHTRPDNNAAEWSAFVRRTRGERRTGSAALDLAYVAAGRFDGYWEMGLKPWDLMAGVLLVTEAGGTVTDYTGQPEPQQREADWRVVASNGPLHAAMLQVLREARGGAA